jgi:hypothetical protein
LKVRCYRTRCRYYKEGYCVKEEVTVDELGTCTDSRPTTQYPQEHLREKSA